MDRRLDESLRQFVKFAVVGGLGTVVNLVVLKAALYVWGLAATTTPFAAEAFASGLAFSVAVVHNYLLNRWWTFRSRGSVAGEFARFLAVSLLGLGLNELAFWLFRAQVGLGVVVSQLGAIACVLPFNFTVNKLWSFRGA